MTPDAAAAFARYNRWMNAKVYDAAARLSDEERKRDRGAFFKSIHATLNHILVADRIWLGRVNGFVPSAGALGPDGIASLDHELAADFVDLRRMREETDAAIDGWVKGLTREALTGDITFVRKGETKTNPLWWIATQMFNHQTHHRGQVTTLLVQAGQDPGSTDIYAMLVSGG